MRGYLRARSSAKQGAEAMPLPWGVVLENVLGLTEVKPAALPAVLCAASWQGADNRAAFWPLPSSAAPLTFLPPAQGMAVGKILAGDTARPAADPNQPKATQGIFHTR